MPYITKERRDIVDSVVPTLEDFKPVAGDYVYWYYKQMVFEFRKNPSFTKAYYIYKDVSNPYNTFLGITRMPDVLRVTTTEVDTKSCIELAWQEFYRRIVGPYEDKKIIENGDI